MASCGNGRIELFPLEVHSTVCVQAVNGFTSSYCKPHLCPDEYERAEDENNILIKEVP